MFLGSFSDAWVVNSTNRSFSRSSQDRNPSSLAAPSLRALCPQHFHYLSSIQSLVHTDQAAVVVEERLSISSWKAPMEGFLRGRSDSVFAHFHVRCDSEHERGSDPNPGFEAWTAFNPNGWETTNQLGVAAPITSSATRNSGQMAVREKCSSPSILCGRRPAIPNSPRLSFLKVCNSIICLSHKEETSSG